VPVRAERLGFACSPSPLNGPGARQDLADGARHSSHPAPSRRLAPGYPARRHHAQWWEGQL